MRTLTDLLTEIPRYQAGGDVDVVRRAYEFSEEIHRGQHRVSGEPYHIHPLAVAGLLVEFRMDATTVAAGLLHDVLEDTATSKTVLVERFGDDIAELVDGVTKIGKLAFGSREERQAENFRKMLVAMARDIRVLMIKLADRLHNMRTLHYLSPEKQRAIGQETLDIYAPLAHRLGMAKVKGELEDLALKALHPEVYDDLQRRVAKRRLEREAEINQVIAILTKKLSEVGIPAQITGRPKHFYSIYKKMQGGRDFDEIYDLTAVRMLAPTVRECYGALGIVHSLWKPVPGRFKDFIAIPKSNMYQSLHTTVIGPKGDPVEIQIRTHEMHRIAEEGIAAHWLYKEKKDRSGLDEAFVWLRQLLEWQKEMKDPREFMETVKVDLFPDEVYVFTPKGDVKALPEGSTPIDFAYAVHTEVGNHCAGARVNGKLVPLRHVLRQGDIVEVVTSATQKPSRDWLKTIKSTRARSKVKQWLRTEERARSVSIGRELLDREAKKYRVALATILESEELRKLAVEHGYTTVDDLLAGLGYGKLAASTVVARFVPADAVAEPRPDAKPVARPRTESGGVTVKGVDDVLVRFAKCCGPVPGDAIVGFITRGRGITVHAGDCANLAAGAFDSERTVAVEWAVADQQALPVKIAVHIGRDRPGLLAEISTAISSRHANIVKAEVNVTEDRKGLNHFTVEVKDLSQLQGVMGAIAAVKDVIGVERVRGL
ncbi:MAG TPA: bifunctional (p)ppGpp synthetase/guanosine-3',5'-bis(diphosphate) 3'-pyrophosphohydrolase [Methylomirabilota bacterium]|jgi:GTP pyrophosphokinase